MSSTPIGYFAGAQVLHWAEGNAVLAGDAVAVASDRRYVRFIYSYPNLIPVSPAAMRRIVEKLEPWEFDRIFGGWWGEIVEWDAKEAHAPLGRPVRRCDRGIAPGRATFVEAVSPGGTRAACSGRA